jgi:transposase
MSQVRLRAVNREQLSFRGESLDQMLPPDHPVRDVWALVGGWDVSGFLTQVKSVPGKAGAPAFDPRVLLTLWIQAILDGYSSARELADLCEHHLIYRWICGDEPVNYHTLADFRSSPEQDVDALLTQVVAAAFAAGIASPVQVAQDGMKVRANAGRYRRKPKLDEYLSEAKRQVEALKERPDDRDGGSGVSRRAQASRERAVTERYERLKQARDELAKLTEANAKRAADSRTRAASVDPAKLRVSTTDPEARKMRMSDCGIRSAFNVQFATTTQGGIIVGVAVTNAATDHGLMGRMMDQVEQRTGVRPKEILVDNGYAVREEITELEKQDIRVYAPVKDEAKAKAVGRDPYAARRGDTPEVAAWRKRMGTEDAKAIYRLRGPTAEWANAQCRNRGLRQFRLRGLAKVTREATWYVLSHNIGRILAHQRAESAGHPP